MIQTLSYYHKIDNIHCYAAAQATSTGGYQTKQLTKAPNNKHWPIRKFKHHKRPIKSTNFDNTQHQQVDLDRRQLAFLARLINFDPTRTSKHTTDPRHSLTITKLTTSGCYAAAQAPAAGGSRTRGAPRSTLVHNKLWPGSRSDIRIPAINMWALLDRIAA